jgi:hypothetical protein
MIESATARTSATAFKVRPARKIRTISISKSTSEK